MLGFPKVLWFQYDKPLNITLLKLRVLSGDGIKKTGEVETILDEIRNSLRKLKLGLAALDCVNLSLSLHPGNSDTR